MTHKKTNKEERSVKCIISKHLHFCENLNILSVPKNDFYNIKGGSSTGAPPSGNIFVHFDCKTIIYFNCSQHAELPIPRDAADNFVCAEMLPVQFEAYLA